MNLNLTKRTEVDDETQEEWFIVECDTDGSEPKKIPYTYTFETTETEEDMQSIIVNDLTDKGYTNLDPVNWV